MSISKNQDTANMCFRRIVILLSLGLLAILAGCSDDEPNGSAPYSVIETFAGTGLPAISPDSLPAQQSALYFPQDLTFGPDGNLYIADWNNHRITAVHDSIMYTVCGNGIPGEPSAGKPLEISLLHPTGVAFAPNGNMIIFAWENSKILSLDFGNDFVTPIAGAAISGYGGDGGQAILANLNYPVGGFFDDDGRLDFMDQRNFCIRRIENDIISTFAGVPTQPGFVDSVPSAEAKFDLPSGPTPPPAGRIEIDAASAKIYVADTNNQRVRILEPAGPVPAMLSPAHEDYDVHTFAGNGTQGFMGDGGPALNASLDSPSDVAVDSQGNVYIADTNNHCIRKVDTHGVITTFAGTPGSPDGLETGEVGDGASPTHAFLNHPTGICFDSHDNLYIADMGHNRVRVIWKDPDAHH